MASSVVFQASSQQYENYRDAIVSSTNSTQDADEPYGSLRKRSRFWDFRKVVVKFWLWETAACVFSLICLVSIVGILIYENGKLLDQWEWSVPPTAVVSFIGTLGKASLVLVLSQILSQLKWLHFRETRSLRDVRTFDEASRGPLGAIMVVLTFNSKKLLASVAACVMVLTILIDPFVQLVFTFPSRLVEDRSQQAVFHSINDWTDMRNDIGGHGSDLIPSPRIITSISQGLTSTRVATSAFCPSGNCVWPEPVKTLGVCGSCSDVTPDVSVTCFTAYNRTVKGNCPQAPDGEDFLCQRDLQVRKTKWISSQIVFTCNYTFKDGSTIQAQKFMSNDSANTGDAMREIYRTVWNSTYLTGPIKQIPVEPTIASSSNNVSIELDGQPVVPEPSLLQGTGTPSLSDIYMGLSYNPLFSFTTIQLPAVDESEMYNSTHVPTARCWNCEVYWCEKSFEGMQVTDDVLSIQTISTRRLWFIVDTTNRWYGFFPNELNILKETVQNFRYRVDSVMFNYLGRLFDSYVVGPTGGDEPDGASWWARSHSYQADLFNEPEALVGLVKSEDLNVTIHSLTDSLTETIRTGPSSTGVVGQTLVSKSFIQVRWVWLALPLMLTILTCILLMLVAIRSHASKLAVWKDDPLALLLHNIKNTNLLPGNNSNTGTSDLDSLANQVYVRLDPEKPFEFIVSAKKA